MKYISAGILAVLSAVVVFLALGEKVKIFNVLSTEENEKKLTVKMPLRMVLTVIAAAVGFTATVMLYKYCSVTINILRLQFAYICIAGAACVDLRECRIPNVFPAAMAIAGIVSLAAMYFTNVEGVMAYMLSSVVGTVACAVCMFIVYALTKGGIGMGDIKLLCALSLLCGANSLGCTVAVGAVSCGLVTAVLLIMKKKKIKDDALPFAPFAFLGFAVSVILPIS